MCWFADARAQSGISVSMRWTRSLRVLPRHSRESLRLNAMSTTSHKHIPLFAVSKLHMMHPALDSSTCHRSKPSIAGPLLRTYRDDRWAPWRPPRPGNFRCPLTERQSLPCAPRPGAESALICYDNRGPDWRDVARATTRSREITDVHSIERCASSRAHCIRCGFGCGNRRLDRGCTATGNAGRASRCDSTTCCSPRPTCRR